VRENARGARDSLSTEVWERINQFYHTTTSYDAAKLQYDGLQQFAQKIEESSYVIKGYIDNTLIRNEVWLLISLGVHLERAVQVALILKTKLADIGKMETSKQGSPLENYMLTTLLQSAEARDMYLRHYKTSPNKLNVLDFLDETLGNLYSMASLIEDKYLNYDVTLQPAYYDYTVPN
ncbi:MAG: alpha-E domain-containing protein, partial [Sphingobacteriales bacterium]